MARIAWLRYGGEFVPSTLCEPTLHRRLLPRRPPAFSLTIIWYTQRPSPAFICDQRSLLPGNWKVTSPRSCLGGVGSIGVVIACRLARCCRPPRHSTLERMGSSAKTNFRCAWVDKSYWIDGDLTAGMSMQVTDYKCNPSKNRKKIMGKGGLKNRWCRWFKTRRNLWTQEQKDTYLRTGICVLLVSASSSLSLCNTCLYRV